jgi:hypothetical protein
MEILEACDLVGTLRGAALLAGCDHKTVAHYVAEREAGGGDWRRKQRPWVAEPGLWMQWDYGSSWPPTAPTASAQEAATPNVRHWGETDGR